MADDQIKNAEKLAALQSAEEIRLKNITNAEEARSVVLKNRVDALKEEERLIMSIQAMGDDYNKDLLENLQTAKDNLLILEQQGKATDRQLELARDAVDAATDELAVRDKLNKVNLDAITDARKAHEALLESHNKELDLKDQLNSKSKQILSAMTGIDDMAKNTAIGSFFVTAQAIGFAGALALVGTAMKSVFTMTNILGSAGIGLVIMLFRSAMAVESARAEFNAATAASGKFDAQIQNSASHMKRLGMETRDYTAALQSMRNNLSFFKDLPDQGDALAKLNAQMGKFGVDQGQLNTVQELQHTLGGGNVEQFTLNLHAAAQAMDMDLNKVVANASQHMQKFAVHGDRMGEVFIKMQSHAKKLGVEISDLTDITEQYNTVSGSIAAAAKLNMALGGAYINANKMRGLSDEQRVVEIKKAIEASGKRLDQMSVEEKRRFIQLGGFKNEALALKMLGKVKAEELEKDAAQAAEAEGSWLGLGKAVEGAMTPMQKIVALFSDLHKAVSPILDVLHGFANLMKDIFGQGMLGSIMTIVGLWGSWKVATWVLGGAFSALGGMIKGKLGPALSSLKNKLFTKKGSIAEEMDDIAGGADNMTDGFNKAAPQTTVMGHVATMSAKQIMALGGAILLAAIGIGIIVASLALLASQMKEMSVGQMAMFVVAIAAIGAVLYFVIPAFVSSAAGVTAAAWAFLGFGIAVGIAAPATLSLGLGMLVFAAGFAVVMLLLPLFAVFVGLVTALTVVAPVMVAAGVMIAGGFIAMSAGLLALGFSLIFVSSQDLESLGNMMMGLGMVAANMGAGIGEAVPTVRQLMNTLDDLGAGTIFGAAAGMNKITDTFALVGLAASMASWGVEELAEAMEAIPESKVTAFTQMFETVTESAPAVQSLTPSAVDNVSTLVDEAFRFNSALMIGGMFGGASAFVEAITATTNTTAPSTGTAGGSAETPPVIFEIDGREIGKVVERYIAKKNKLPVKTKTQ